jgi:hypothetical protein
MMLNVLARQDVDAKSGSGISGRLSAGRSPNRVNIIHGLGRAESWPRCHPGEGRDPMTFQIVKPDVYLKSTHPTLPAYWIPAFAGMKRGDGSFPHQPSEMLQFFRLR